MCMRECLYSVFTLKALHYLYSVKYMGCVTLSHHECDDFLVQFKCAFPEPSETGTVWVCLVNFN